MEKYHKPIFFIFMGIILAGLFNLIKPETGIKISHLDVEIYDSHPPFLKVKGNYIESDKTVYSIQLDCYLDKKICTESSFLILKNGSIGIGSLREFSVIENTPTKVVVQYKSGYANYTYIIELDKREIYLKNQSNPDSSDFNIYKLKSGAEILKESF